MTGDTKPLNCSVDVDINQRDQSESKYETQSVEVKGSELKLSLESSSQNDSIFLTNRGAVMFKLSPESAHNERMH